MGNRNNLLLSIAQQKAEQLAKHPKVEAVIVCGSVAIGQSDDASDIDMMVYYKDEIPEDVQQAELVEIERSGGKVRSSSKKVLMVNHKIQGVLCEVAHFQIDNIEERIKKVIEEHDTDKINHLIVNGILNSRTLYDRGLIEAWKQRLKVFPQTLAIKLVEKHLQLYPKSAYFDLGIPRDDLIFIADMMLNTQENLIGILCGLNKMYLPGKMKGLSYPINLMQIKPEDLLRRFMNIWKVEHRIAVEDIIKLVYETWDLVDRHMPEISTVEVRQNFE